MKTLFQKPLVQPTRASVGSVQRSKIRAAKTQRKRTGSAANSVRITITISSQLNGYLRGLLELGLYGTSISDVAERLICESLHADTKRLRSAILSQEQLQNENKYVR